MCNKLRMKTLLNIPDLFLTVLLLVAFQASASKSQNNISLSCKENNNLYKTLKENKIACVRRVSEMAPFVNNVVSVAREKGVLIVHAPSDCMNYYNNTPARKLGQKYKSKKALSLISDNKLDSEKDAVWPIDQSDGGCDCSPECKQGSPWTHQIDLIEISDKDAISDSGAEIAGLFYQKGIKNVILMGVHENMCVIGRSFGLRNMIRLGFNVVLIA